MAKFFDENKWEELINKPDWYLDIVPELIKIKEEAEKRTVLKEEYKKEIYGFFLKHLNADDVCLGDEAGNWDKERKSIDSIIIHHTSFNQKTQNDLLSAVELVRLYAPYYYKPDEVDAQIRGKPISSGHTREGRQIFYPYHWMIRNDGRPERLLLDEEVGWQAGNWEVNCRSIAVCFDDDFEDSVPSDNMIFSAATIIKDKYPQVDHKNIFGHREINPKTTCPGNKFLGGWKQKLLDALQG